MINSELINGVSVNSKSSSVSVGQASVNFEQTVFSTGEATVYFEINVADLGTPIVYFDELIFSTGEATTYFEIRILHGGEARVYFLEDVYDGGDSLVWIKETVLATGEASVNFEVQVTYGTGQADVSFEQMVFDTDEDTLGAYVYFSESVVDQTLPVSLVAPDWDLQVIVTRNDSVVEDITSKLLGQLTVEAEEGAARVATVIFEPSLNHDTKARLYDYIGASVVINCNLISADGLNISTYRLFTGEVDDPEYDVMDDVVTLTCTDGLQEKFEGRTKEEINAMLPSGFWSVHVFSETESMWEYAQNRISTMPYSVDLNAYASSIRITPWDTELTSPDFTFDEDIIDDGSLDVELAGKRDLKNKLNLEAEFRYERLKLRKRNITWNYGLDWCGYLAKPFQLPSKDMITQAIEGTGWPIESISFNVRPPTGSFSCPDGIRYWLNNTPVADEQYCVGFVAVLQKRWSQTITERHKVEVAADQSIATVGEVSYETSLSVQVDSDTTEWDNSLESDEDLEIFAPRMKVVWDGSRVDADPFDIPSTAYQQINGDWVIDWDTYPAEGNLEAFEYAFETIYNQARTEMRAAHRENYVRLSIPVNPLLDVIHTCQVDTPRLAAKGKVHQFTHIFDIESGEATTEIVVAISIGFGGVNNEDTFSVASRPFTDTSELAEAPPTPRHITRVGGESSTPAFNEELDGYSTNYDSAFGIDPTLPDERYYPTMFRATMPDVEEEATAPVDAKLEDAIRQVYKVYIPNDLFELYSNDEV